MKVILSVSSFIILLFLSCTGKNDSSVITYQLKKSDYVEKITVPGTVQAVNSVPVMYQASSGQMTVLRIAPDGAFVNKGDTICVLSSPALESSYEGQLTSIEKLEAELKRTEADNQLNIALLEAQLATSEAQLKISSLDSLKIKFETETNQRLLKLDMQKAMIEKQKTERKLAATKMIRETDIMKKKARIMQEKMRAQTYADQINSMIVIAQREGVVQRVEAPTIMFSSGSSVGILGGPIREGSVLYLFSTPLLQFPDLSRMQISADLVEADFRKIEKGQKVFVTVDAANKLLTTGKVNRKSLASSASQRYTRSTVKSYEVVIDVDSCHLKMKPGLSAVCEIILKEATDTLFVPTLSIFEKDSAKIVYVKGKKEFIPVNVGTGTSGSSYTIITSGLKGDEIIALTEPPINLIAKENDRTDTIKNHNFK
ncbi:MAG: hypothetical protein NT092_08360 [Bacteroidia bacterium]|nr:hypothetical protein [Bacteroidia bacterium]